MRLFLDSSALLAAAGSDRGASRAVFAYRSANRWELLTSAYCVAEVQRNLCRLPDERSGEKAWEMTILPALQAVTDVVALDRPLVLDATKDRPIVITALAEECAYLLTLDRRDFKSLLGRDVYGLRIHTPGSFLAEMRAKRNLIEPG